ncbi:AAA family ATPase [Streptomyces sp. MBT57]|nr:AAA family ATPase [Streptomyces sp. MBT57]
MAAEEAQYLPSSGSVAFMTSFVGRASELESLDEALRKAQSGRASCVLVEGPAGIGKTALVRHWLARLASEEHLVLRALCDPSERDLAYGTIGQLVSRTDVVDSERYPLLSGAIPAAAEPFQVGSELLSLLDELQTGKPIIVIVDDIQWADRPSAQVLGFVQRRLEADAVLTVLLTRDSMTSGQAEWLYLPRMVAALPSYHQLTLTGLSIEEVTDLATLLYGCPVARGAAERLHAHSRGHALHLRTLLSEVPMESVLRERSVLPVPTSLSQHLRRQLQNLPGPAQSLVEGIAVLDAPTPLAIAARVASVAEPDAALEPLLAINLVEWWPSRPSIPVAIAHGLQRQAILGSVSPHRLRSLHAAAADLVPRDMSWVHRVAASDGSDSQLAWELQEAAAGRLAAGDFVKAATLLLWASEVAVTCMERENLLATAAAWLLWAQQYTRVEPLLERIRATEPCALRSLVLGGYGTPRGDPGAADLLVEALRVEKAGAGVEFVPVMASTWLGINHVVRGHASKAVPLLRNALASERLEPSLTPWAVGTLGLAHSYTYGARAALNEYDEKAPSGGPRSVADQTIQRAYRGMISLWAGDLTDAHHDLTKALDTARVAGCAVTAEFTYSNLAATQYFLGYWNESAVNGGLAMAIAESEEKPWALPYAYSVASWVAAGRGDWDRAREMIDRAYHWSRSIAPGYLSIAAVADAVLAQAQGNYPAQLLAVRSILQARPDSGQSALQTWWRPLYVEALIAGDDLDEATRALADMTILAGEAPSLRAAVVWLSGRLAHVLGETRQAYGLFEEGVDLATSSDAPPLHRAMLAHSHGRFLAQEGDRRRAAERFAESRSLFTALGAQPFLKRYRQDFTARTSSPQLTDSRIPISELTNREYDIARLIGRGLTNREISATLFISSKTVEYHLSRIYQKFLLAGRRELRELVQRSDVFGT